MYVKVDVISRGFRCGPFRSGNCQLDEVFSPEQFPIDLTQYHQGVDGWASWRCSYFRKHETLGCYGIAQLERLYRTNEHVTAYAYGHLFAEDDCLCTIRVYSDDAVKLWINELEVHRHDCWRGLEGPGDEIKGIQLYKGLNSFLIKIVNGEGSWGFGLTLVEARVHKTLRQERLTTSPAVATSTSAPSAAPAQPALSLVPSYRFRSATKANTKARQLLQSVELSTDDDQLFGLARQIAQVIWPDDSPSTVQGHADFQSIYIARLAARDDMTDPIGRVLATLQDCVLKVTDPARADEQLEREDVSRKANRSQLAMGLAPTGLVIDFEE